MKSGAERWMLGAGTITQETDADDDDLKDYQEFNFYDTNPVQSDTDHDTSEIVSLASPNDAVTHRHRHH